MSEYILHFNREPDITQMRLEPSPIEIVPPTIEDALFTAREENPLLSGNEFLARAARFTVEAERSGYLPVLDWSAASIMRAMSVEPGGCPRTPPC